MTYRFFISIVALGLLLSSASIGLFADAPTPAAPDELTDSQKQVALEFAKEHHPQLNVLINKLRRHDEAGYAKALKDISRTHDRLDRLKARDPERHVVELSLWKTDSRIRLLAAQMSGDHRASLEVQLRGLFNERTDLRLEQLELERQRLSSRLERLDEQISQLHADRQQVIDKDVDRLIKSVRTRTSKSSKRPAAKADAASQPAELPRKRNSGSE